MKILLSSLLSFIIRLRKNINGTLRVSVVFGNSSKSPDRERPVVSSSTSHTLYGFSSESEMQVLWTKRRVEQMDDTFEPVNSSELNSHLVTTSMIMYKMSQNIFLFTYYHTLNKLVLSLCISSLQGRKVQLDVLSSRI